MTAPGADVVVDFRNVGKSYCNGAAAVQALRSVSMQIRRGELVALVGKSGSGKSTLVNLTGLLDRASSGSIRICGVNPDQLSADAAARLRNRKIGFVFQGCHLLPDRTVIENVELPLVYQRGPRKMRRARAFDLLDRMRLTHRARAYPPILSGGEKQRAAIARALITDPDLVIADEPTAALDPENSEIVLNIFKSLADQGRAVLMVTHDPVAERAAGRVIRLDRGRIRAEAE
ncbi:ABC transporter ATP-binding protein [Leisingera caerulea]|uniref:ABC transporter ATP-binding protein n=1 Tax=Leisingera caerulea TaxID=506591 RepID=A0A9Q9HIW0_LEICA|nr:ABC transporter ATP-binding protein [Leisingera caerulea]UWQ55949.1 ABC transporter ATP-binding protein [Leisingera caerulea]